MLVPEAVAVSQSVAAPVPVATAPAPAPVEAPKPAEPMVLGPEFVRALGGRAVSVAAPPEPAPATTPEPPAGRPAVRHALVVDDSLVARMELGRVLERHGWDVEWVETAAEMWSALPDGVWSIVFVDVSLPDARGRAHLKMLAAKQSEARHRFELVALTRDARDERHALDAGIVRMLRKPFAPGAVERTVRELMK